MDPVASRPEPAVRERIPLYVEALERLLLSLRGLPSQIDRAPLQAAVEEALRALGRLSRSEIDHEDHLTLFERAVAAVVAVRDARASAGDDDAERAQATLRRIEVSLAAEREATLDALVVSRPSLRRAPGAASETGSRRFRGSVGVPALHALARGPIAPMVDVAPVVAPDELGPSASTSTSASTSDGELRQLQELARGAMEDIALCSTLRRVTDGEPWPTVARFEQRLLQGLDALAALAFVEGGAERRPEVLEQVLRYAGEVSFDSGRAFVRAFVLGCVEGDDSLRALILGLRRSPPRTHAAQREALSLASSPAIVPAMERLLWDEDASLLRTALEVLRHRRKASFAMVAPLLHHPDPDVLEAAARCLGVVAERALACEALSRMLAEGPLDRVCLAAAESLLWQRATAGLEVVVRALEEDHQRPGVLSERARDGYVRLLALAGGPSHADLLLRSVRHESSGARALGWFGSAAHIAPLLQELAAANDVRRMTGPSPAPFELAAAEALVRISGVCLENADAGLDAPLCVDAQRWRAALQGRPLEPGLKYRFGEPYHPRLSLEDLSDADAPPQVRRDAALELVIAGALVAPLEPTDWVARQRAALHTIGAGVVEAKDAFVPGIWLAYHLHD